jgi:FKBP-type peptidyl-prolyl cis-trans isomerase FkpA
MLYLIPMALMAQTPATKSTSAPAAKSTSAAKSISAKSTSAKSISPASAAKSTNLSKSTSAAKSVAPAGGLSTDEQREVYAIGLSVERSLKQFDFSPAELEIVKRALSDASAGKPAEDLSTWGPRIDELAKARQVRVVSREKAAAKVYLDKAAAEPGSVKTASGMVYRDLTPGNGASPKATDTVKVNYRGTLINGTEFDSSYKRNEAATFPLNQVIKCWTEGVQKMKPGGKARLVCPADLAYGDNGQSGIPGGATLIFEVELLQVMPPAPAPAAAK